jgi:hypothetical protein
MRALTIGTQAIPRTAFDAGTSWTGPRLNVGSRAQSEKVQRLPAQLNLTVEPCASRDAGPAET